MNPVIVAYIFPVFVLALIVFALYAGEHADKIPLLKELVK